MKRLLILAVCVFLMCGCSARRIEEQMMAVTLGVDLTETGVRLCVKTPGNEKEKASGSSGGSASGYVTLEAEGESMERALAVLSATSPLYLNFSQLRQLVIGEAAARSESFMKLVSGVSLIEHARVMALVVICEGEAKAYLDKQEPVVGVRLSKYLDAASDSSFEQGMIPNSRLCAVARDLRQGYRDPVIAYGAVNSYDSPRDSLSPLDMTAGQSPRRGDDPIELLGCAVTDGYRVTGTLTGSETQLFCLLAGSISSVKLYFGQRSVIVSARAPCELSYLEEGALCVRFAAGLRSADGLPVPDDASDILFALIDALVRKLQTLRSDALGFAAREVRRFLTIEDWNAYDFKSRYLSARVRVQVDAQVLGGER